MLLEEFEDCVTFSSALWDKASDVIKPTKKSSRFFLGAGWRQIFDGAYFVGLYFDSLFTDNER